MARLKVAIEEGLRTNRHASQKPTLKMPFAR
jgi:hypothetical protein